MNIQSVFKTSEEKIIGNNDIDLMETEEGEIETLFEDIFEEMDSSEKKNDSNMSIEARRIVFLRDALKNRMGIEYVEREMKQEKFRELYVRNPAEIILKYCFMYNSAVMKGETEGKLKDITAFKHLWKMLGGNDLKSEFMDGHSVKWTKARNGNYVTMGDLRKFILEASRDYENTSKAETDDATRSVNVSVNMINFKSPNPDKEFIDCFRELKKKMSDVSCSLRYYFIKYTYFFLYNQVLDFISTLKFFSQSEDKAYYNICRDSTKQIREGKNVERNLWSIKDGIFTDNEIENIINQVPDKTADEARSSWDESLVISDDYPDEEFETNKANDKRMMVGALIRAAMNNLPLHHSNIKCTDVSDLSPLFLDVYMPKDENENDSIEDRKLKEQIRREKRKKSLRALLKLTDDPIEGTVVQIPLSKLCEKTQIFQNAKKEDSDIHNVLSNAINALTPEDFSSYPIDLKKLYSLLFETILCKSSSLDDENQELDDDAETCKKIQDTNNITEKEMIKSKNKDKKRLYIERIINAEYDMTRSAFLIFLTSIKGALSDYSRLINDKNSLFSYGEGDAPDYRLDFDRVNSILNRVGYVGLCEEAEYDEIDEVYANVFDDEYKKDEYNRVFNLISAVSDFYADHNYIPLPFDIAEISANKVKKYIVSGRGAAISDKP